MRDTFPARTLDITAKQLALLTTLIHRHGKTAYQGAKRAAGIDSGVTLTKLTRAEAARLIRQMIGDNQ